jgi:predicted enzyme related to lactoylglutathione lyase
MSRRLSLLPFVLLLLSVVPTSSLRAQASGIERFGLYVISDDLSRAGAFYRELFQKTPQISNSSLVGFDVEGGLYAIVSRKAFALPSAQGSNVRPYIKVRDIFGEFQRVKKLAAGSLQSEAVVEEGPFRFFRFADPDGNVIEFFSVAVPAS